MNPVGRYDPQEVEEEEEEVSQPFGTMFHHDKKNNKLYVFYSQRGKPGIQMSIYNIKK